MRSVRLPILVIAAALIVTACSGSSTREAFTELVPPEEAARVLDEADDTLVLLDVRTPDEFSQARIAGAINIDFYEADFGDRLAELDRAATYVVYCRTGNRSATAVQMMQELGFDYIYELDGGIADWYEAGYPIE